MTSNMLAFSQVRLRKLGHHDLGISLVIADVGEGYVIAEVARGSASSVKEIYP